MNVLSIEQLENDLEVLLESEYDANSLLDISLMKNIPGPDEIIPEEIVNDPSKVIAMFAYKDREFIEKQLQIEKNYLKIQNASKKVNSDTEFKETRDWAYSVIEKLGNDSDELL